MEELHVYSKIKSKIWKLKFGTKKVTINFEKEVTMSEGLKYLESMGLEGHPGTLWTPIRKKYFNTNIPNYLK